MNSNNSGNKKIKASEKNNKFKKIALLEAVVCIVYIIVSLITCTLIFTIDIPMKSVYYIILMSLAISSFVAGYIPAKKKRTNGLANGIIYNLLPILTITLISMILNEFVFDSRLLISCLLMVIMSASGGVTAVNSRRKPK